VNTENINRGVFFEKLIKKKTLTIDLSLNCRIEDFKVPRPEEFVNILFKINTSYPCMS